MATLAVPDERVAGRGLFRRILVRPELGSLTGAIAIFIFFAVLSETFRSMQGVATWLDPASLLGIMAVAIALLMIGGEFDLSAGVLTGTAGTVTVWLAALEGWNVWLAMAASLAIAVAVGLANGILVVRTRLPSFIITLGMFLMLQGLNLGVTKVITGGSVQIAGLGSASGYESAQTVFANPITIAGQQFRIAILWWVLIVLAATWVLTRTRAGNWILAAGGDANAARATGVPVARTKIMLFVTVSVCAWLVGNIAVLRLSVVQANMGIGEELTYIVAAVIGGCLLTGGYGSAIGAALGALMFGMAQKGIVYAGWESDWYKFFLGAMLLIAVITNQFVRRYAEVTRR
ncbi:ABC transporter permease [Phytohabitans rumicis]|uniref:Xylose transport system permease protein XylH n=1 Tax=Phytohabitans rumicis TaxID=1076125 RepID=A0A6V8L0Q5_9ACTN|nr:ABC transporter permease [Phytohabitans rumicis]GFJ88179.1 sugar ABC transporter permease [Phytohabitans rumicis]